MRDIDLPSVHLLYGESMYISWKGDQVALTFVMIFIVWLSCVPTKIIRASSSMPSVIFGHVLVSKQSHGEKLQYQSASQSSDQLMWSKNIRYQQGTHKCVSYWFEHLAVNLLLLLVTSSCKICALQRHDRLLSAMLILSLGSQTHDSRVEGSPPGHDTAWLFISETGDHLCRVNCLGNCNHHLGGLSLASLRGR